MSKPLNKDKQVMDQIKIKAAEIVKDLKSIPNITAEEIQQRFKIIINEAENEIKTLNNE